MTNPRTARAAAATVTTLTARAVALAAVLAAMLATGCATAHTPPPAPGIGVALSDLARAPGAYVGDTVTVSGELGRILAPRTFTIVGGGEGGRHELLVVVAESQRPLVNTLADSLLLRGAIVQVTGTLTAPAADSGARARGTRRRAGRGGTGERGERGERERHGGDSGLSTSFSERLRNSLTLEAREIVITPRPGLAAAELTGARYPVADAESLIVARSPDTLVGRAAALLQARVQAVESDRAFWIGANSGDRLLVVLPPGTRVEHASGGARTLAPGDTVAVAGIVRALPSDVRFVATDWGLSAAGRGALAGEQIYLDANRVRRLAPASDATGAG